MQEKDFEKDFDKAYAEKSQNYEDHLNIALVGKVSSGKSSLLNAIMGRGRSDPLAEVGAHSGVTSKITAYKLDERVLIIDCPGLDDVRAENSKVTQDFLRSIDLVLFVVTGSADASQKSNYDDLKKSCKKVFVVLNKIDEWDDHVESAYESVVRQWEQVLGTNKIYGTCTKGYDPKMRQSAPMDIRGVDEVRAAIFDFLETEKKAILLAKHLKNKDKYAIGIIATALAAVAGEAFIPGSAVYITATQISAIIALNYLYTGEVLTKTSALALLPAFIGESLGTSAFLWANSFLPPTGVLDLAAAGIAVVITFAMLAAVKWVLENGHSLNEIELLKRAFNKFYSAGAELRNMSLNDIKSKNNIINMIGRLLAKQ